MKKLIALVLALVCVFGLVGCNAGKKGSLENDEIDYCTFIVMEATEEYLLVAEIDEDGKAIEAKQYSVPNEFHSSNIVVGDRIKIEHNGEILETFPMQFGRIFSMEYQDKEKGLNVVVHID